MTAANAINLDKQNDEELLDGLKYVSSHLKQSMKDATEEFKATAWGTLHLRKPSLFIITGNMIFQVGQFVLTCPSFNNCFSMQGTLFVGSMVGRGHKGKKLIWINCKKNRFQSVSKRKYKMTRVVDRSQTVIDGVWDKSIWSEPEDLACQFAALKPAIDAEELYMAIQYRI